MCVCSSLHNVLIPKSGLFCRAHFLPGRVDALAHGVGFQIGNAHVNAQLLQRLGLAGNTAPQLRKGLFRVQIVERRHITGKAGQCKRHILHSSIVQIHAFQHSAHGAGKLFGRKLAHAEAAGGFFCKVFHRSCALFAKGDVHHVLHFLQIRGDINAAFCKIGKVAHHIAHGAANGAKTAYNGLGGDDAFYHIAKGQAVLVGLFHAVCHVIGAGLETQHLFCGITGKGKNLVHFSGASGKVSHGAGVVFQLPCHAGNAGLALVDVSSHFIDLCGITVKGILCFDGLCRLLAVLFGSFIQRTLQIGQHPNLLVVFFVLQLQLLLGLGNGLAQHLIFGAQSFHALVVVAKLGGQQLHFRPQIFYVGFNGRNAGIKGFFSVNAYPRANVVCACHLTTSQLTHLLKQIASGAPRFLLVAALRDLIAGDLIQHLPDGKVVDFPPG